MSNAAALDEATRCPWVWKRISFSLPHDASGRVAVSSLRWWMLDEETRALIRIAYRRVMAKRAGA